jgi:hypothetical protein
MIEVISVRLSQRLRIIRLFAWMVDAPPWLRRLMGFIVTPFTLFVIAVAIEGRIPALNHQYAGLIPGDLLLALVWLCATELAATYLPAESGQWYQTRWFQTVKLGVGAFFLLLLTVPEIYVTATHYGEPNILTWGEMFSPTKLYHTVVLAVYGYMMTAVIFPAVLSVPRINWKITLAKMLIFIGICGWGYAAFYYDNTHPRPDKKYVHVGNGWPWQRDHFWQGTPK